MLERRERRSKGEFAPLLGCLPVHGRWKPILSMGSALPNQLKAKLEQSGFDFAGLANGGRAQRLSDLDGVCSYELGFEPGLAVLKQHLYDLLQIPNAHRSRQAHDSMAFLNKNESADSFMGLVRRRSARYRPISLASASTVSRVPGVNRASSSGSRSP